jgi:putative peptidoglycan lipid II flippase
MQPSGLPVSAFVVPSPGMSSSPASGTPSGDLASHPSPENPVIIEAGGRAGNLARSAGLVSLAVMTSRILGLVRDQVLLIYFGAGDRMDAFNVAFRLPNLVRDLFAEGAMSAAFVPTFTRELQQKGKAAAWELGNLVISGLIVATGIIAILGMLGAGPLTHWIAGEYAKTPGKIELTTTLTRIMFPFLTLVAVAVAFMGMLNALRYFFIPALAPAMFNLGAIVSVFAIVPVVTRVGWDPMVGLALGTLLGGIGQMVIQWPSLHRAGFRFRFRLVPKDSRLREILLLMAPGTVGLAAVQINQLVNVWLATGEGTGKVTYLQTAFRLMYLPIGLFGVSIATAALPTIARHAAADDRTSIRDSVSQALRMMLMLNVPATFGLIALAVPIIQLLVEYGEVLPHDTAGIARALIFYAPGLVGYSAVKIASPTFYALKDSRTPVMVSLLAIAVNVILNLTLVGVLGYAGLALGTGLAALVNAGLLFWFLRKHLGGLDGRRVSVAVVKILIASVVMGLAAWGAEGALSQFYPGGSAFHRLVRVLLSVGVGLATLALMAKLLRLQEFELALARVLRRHEQLGK